MSSKILDFDVDFYNAKFVANQNRVHLDSELMDLIHQFGKKCVKSNSDSAGVSVVENRFRLKADEVSIDVMDKSGEVIITQPARRTFLKTPGSKYSPNVLMFDGETSWYPINYSESFWLYILFKLLV